jgi:hypothetical protein
MRLVFDITVNYKVEEYLGIKMEELPNGDVKLTQPKLLKQMLDEYESQLGSTNGRGIPTPQRQQDPYTISESAELGQTEYLHLLGALIYLTKSRPDIATAVSFLSCYSAHPTVLAFQELLHCLRYLRSTQSYGLILRAGESGRELKLTCYVDASYLTHKDSKSHTGFTLSFGSVGSFYSKSTKQTSVATSSTHAEIRALYSAIIDIVYVIYLCDELHRPISLPAVVLEDNQPAIDVTKELSSRVKKCKHFLVLISYVREQVVNGVVSIADVLTKIVTGSEFVTKAGMLLGTQGGSI